MAAVSTGLSRAYAVLRQLEALRREDIIHPILSPDASSITSESGVQEKQRVGYTETRSSDGHSKGGASTPEHALPLPKRSVTDSAVQTSPNTAIIDAITKTPLQLTRQSRRSTSQLYDELLRRLTITRPDGAPTDIPHQRLYEERSEPSLAPPPLAAVSARAPATFTEPAEVYFDSEITSKAAIRLPAASALVVAKRSSSQRTDTTTSARQPSSSHSTSQTPLPCSSGSNASSIAYSGDRSVALSVEGVTAPHCDAARGTSGKGQQRQRPASVDSTEGRGSPSPPYLTRAPTPRHSRVLSSPLCPTPASSSVRHRSPPLPPAEAPRLGRGTREAAEGRLRRRSVGGQFRDFEALVESIRDRSHSAGEPLQRPQSFAAYVETVLTASSGRLQQELTALADVCGVNARADEGRETVMIPDEAHSQAAVEAGITLTVLLNRQGALRHAVVPLLVAQLEAQLRTPARGSDVALTHLLCALIGLGGAAEGALPTLVSCVKQQLGDYRLTTMAVRAVGGEAGVQALCQLLAVSSDPAVQAAAAYGLSTVSRPVAGHTTVVCTDALWLGGKGSQLTMKIYALAKEPHGSHYSEEMGSGGDDVPLQKAPAYLPCGVLLPLEAGRVALLAYASSSYYRVETSYDGLPTVLRDAMEDGAVMACLDGATNTASYSAALETHTRALSHVRAELSSLSSAHSAPLLLPFSYSTHFMGQLDVLFRVEQSLLTAVLETPHEGVREQALISLVALPLHARLHVATPLTHFVAHYAAAFAARWVTAQRSASQHGGQQCRHNATAAVAEATEEAVLAAGTVSLGAAVNRSTASQALQEEALELLLGMLTSPRWRLRHGACVGLGLQGGVSALDPSRALAAITAALLDGTVAAETCAWALLRYGATGVRQVLSVLLHTPALSLSAAVSCARSLARVDAVASCANEPGESSEELLDELVQSLGSVIVGQGTLAEEAVIECVYALAEVVDRAAPPPAHPHRGGATREMEAALYYTREEPCDCFEAIKALIEATIVPFAVLKALFFVCCKFGGPFGEVYATRAAMQGLTVMTRAAAAFGLRACGPTVIRAVAVTINDTATEVRAEALDTLDCIGVGAAARVLAVRLPQHREQVVAALRDCLLRDMGRGVRRVKAQELYDALVTSSQSLRTSNLHHR